MRFRFVLLTTVFILVATTIAIAPLEPSSNTKNLTDSDVGGISERQLRVANASDEERGIITSIKMWMKTTYWAQIQKSDTFVKEALKLDGLTEAAMKASPKYKYYLKFLYKAEGVEMDNWRLDKVNPTTIWNKLGLNTMSPVQREDSDALRIYMRYARKYDSDVYHREYKAYTPTTDGEMDVLLRVWAQANRPSDYVLKRLGILVPVGSHYSYVSLSSVKSYPTNAQMKANPNYSKYETFKDYKRQYWLG